MQATPYKCYDIAFSEPLFVLDGATYLNLQGRPVIYIWRRQAEVLYVGLSATALGRVGTHNVIARVEPVLDGDTIEFIECGTADWLAAQAIEQELINELRPRYNAKPVRAGTELRRVMCLTCRAPFVQRRAWQRWCSKTCRSGRPNS